MATRCLCSPPPLLAQNSHFSVRRANSRRIISVTRSLPTQLQTCRTVIAFNSGHGRKLNIVRAVEDDDHNEGDGSAGEPNKGRQLWKTELLSNEFESLDDEVRQSATLKRDIERLSKKEEVEKLLSQAADGSGKQQNPLDQRGGAVIDVADKVLVADFFFILFILAWLLAGLAERTALKSTSLIDSWLPLWPSVFQPALGVFMAGALFSALTKRWE